MPKSNPDNNTYRNCFWFIKSILFNNSSLISSNEVSLIILFSIILNVTDYYFLSIFHFSLASISCSFVVINKILALILTIINMPN